jgi:phosphoglycerate dehydrogenase-like enzyme
VAVLGASASEPPPGIDRAETLAKIVYAPDGEALGGRAATADALFFWRARRDWLESAWPLARLRWIQSASDGVDGLLFPALVKSDVTVTNMRGVFDDSIAEWAIAAILAFETGLRASVLDTATGVWNDERPRGRAKGSRLLVVGPGPIGRASGRRALALGMEVELLGRAARPDAEFGHVLGPEDLLAALSRADHVLDTLPLAPGTRLFFGPGEFAAMKPSAIFYNVGRGATVDQRALIEALADGSIGGAALDVFEEEPLPQGSPLWSLPNVIVSPHICGDFEDWERAVVEVFVDNLGRFVGGEPLRNLVDKAAGFGLG